MIMVIDYFVINETPVRLSALSPFQAPASAPYPGTPGGLTFPAVTAYRGRSLSRRVVPAGPRPQVPREPTYPVIIPNWHILYKSHYFANYDEIEL